MDSSHPSIPPNSLPHSIDAALAQLSLTERFDSSSLRLHSRQVMLALSYLIEDQAAGTPDTIVVAAFQRFSYFSAQAARYAMHAANYHHTYILGLADVQPRPILNSTFLAFPTTSPLVHEWVVLALGPRCSAGLFARDLEAQQPQTRSRQFAGILTTDTTTLDAVAAHLEEQLQLSLLPTHRDTQATHASAMRLRQAIPGLLRKQRRG